MSTTIITENRLKHELEEIKKNPNLHWEPGKNNPRIWHVSFKGADNTLYEKEEFKLKFEFLDGYVSNYYNLINIFYYYSL